MDNATLWVAGIIAAGIIALGGYFIRGLQGFTEKHAAPIRADKPNEADRTLTEKLIVEADRRADLLNIEKYDIFLQNFVAMHLLDIMKTAPVVGPIATAADYVDRMLESLRRRNPDLAASMNQSRTTAQEKLAGEIGKVVKDKLTVDLLVAGAPAVEPRPEPKPDTPL